MASSIWDDELDRKLEELMRDPSVSSGSKKYMMEHMREARMRQHMLNQDILNPMIKRTRQKPSNLERLAMRMGWDDGKVKTLQHLDIVALPDKVMVWVITKDDFQSVVIEDDVSMFPSDALVTQLRLLEKM